MTAESASEAMISTLKGFNMGVDEAERIVDRYNEVANHFAIDTAGISTAIEKSGASLYAAGNDLNKALGMIVAANDSLQNPETVGTILKTISMRLRGASVADLEELGIDTEGMSQGVKSVVKQFKAMADIDIMEGTSYKNTYRILDELYEKWESLNDAERAALTEAVAGKRGGSVMSSLMNNWKDARDTVETASNSLGSAAKEQENYAKSIQFSLDRVKASLEELSYDFIDSGLIKDFIELGNSALQFLDWIIDDANALIPLLGAIAGGIMSIKGTGIFDTSSGHNIFGNIIASVKNQGLSSEAISLGLTLQDVDVIERYADALNNNIPITQQLQDELNNCSTAAQSYVAQCSKSADGTKEMATGLRTVSAGAKAASVAMNLLSAAVNMAVVALISWGIQKLSEWIDHQIHAYEYAEEAFNESKNQLEALNNELDTTRARIEELQNKGSLSFVDQDELNKLQQQNELLALQIENEKTLLKLRGAELDRENEEKYEKDFRVSQQQVDDYYQNGLSAYDGAETDSNIGWDLAQRKGLLDQLKEAEEEQNSDLVDSLQIQLVAADLAIQTHLKTLLDMLENAEATGNNTLANSIKDSIKVIYSNIGQASTWNTQQFDQIFSGKDIEKTKDELIALAHAGDLNIDEFPKLAKAINEADFIGVSNNAKAFTEQLQALWAETEEGTAYFNAIDRFGSKTTRHNGRDELTQESEGFNDWIDNQQSSDYYLIDSDQFAEELENQRNLFKEHAEESKQIIDEANRNLEEEYKKISDWGLEEYYDAIKNDTIQHVFGNVDMDKRAIIEYNNEILESFKDGMSSWEQEFDEDGNLISSYYTQIQEAVANGEKVIDTVYGGADPFYLDNQEITVSFTPILVDENGQNPQFLTRGTVDNYIQTILNMADEAIDKSGEKWTPERVYAKALEIDAKGINIEQYNAAGEMVGQQFVHGIISGIDNYTGEGGASIGADLVSMLTHFVGKFGAVGIATDELADATNGLGDAYSHTEQEAKILDATLEKIKEEASLPFDSFANTAVGERIQHLNDLFNTGEIPFREYMDALQTEFDNFDASSFTNTLEEAKAAEAQFFVDSTQVAAQGLGSLFQDFDSGAIDVNEYLDGYIGLAGMVDNLTDSLQKNSEAWSEEGQAMSDAQNKALDNTQQSLSNSIAVIESFQDSIYSLTQINAGAIEAGTDEYKAHLQVIAEDVKGIIDSGGEDAEILASRLGTTTEEIAQSMYNNVANLGVAEQGIMDNTNNAITNMANAIGTLFETIGNEIANFKADLKFELSGEKSFKILGKELFKIPDTLHISGSGKSLSAIGNAVKAFGESVKNNVEGQKLTLEDFHINVSEDSSGSGTGNNKGRKGSYKPKNATKNYENKLKNLQDSQSGGGGGGSDKDAKDAADDFYDYFERLIKVLDQNIDLLKAHLEDVFGSQAKNTIIGAEETLIKQKMDGYAAALDMYQKKANEALAKLPADVASKIVSGAVAIDQFVGEGNEEIKTAISDYENWADKVAECKQQLVELKEAIRDLELEKFNNIVEDFTNQFDIRQNNAIDLISKQIDLFKEAGQLIGESFYEEQKEQTLKQIDILNKEKDSLINQLNAALDAGVEIGSDEWLNN